MSKFQDYYLRKRVASEPVDPTEAGRLQHFADIPTSPFKVLRSRTIYKFFTPKNRKPIQRNPQPTNSILSRYTAEETLIAKKLSFEDLTEDLSVPKDLKMAAFVLADFNRVIPEYKGDQQSLEIFIRRCDAFHSSLNDAGKTAFLNNIIYKLSGTAFLIFEKKAYNDWATLKADIIDGISVKRSASAIQNELVAMKQLYRESAKTFADRIREKLKELSIL